MPAFEIDLRLADTNAAVLRGGRCLPSDLEKNAQATFNRTSRYGVSARGGADLERLLRGLPHRVFRRTTVGELDRAGFEVEVTGAFPHCTIWLPALDDGILARLERCFGPPEVNPLTSGEAHNE